MYLMPCHSCHFSCHVMPIHVMPIRANFSIFMPFHVISCGFMPFHANFSIFMPIHVMFPHVMPVHASCQLMSCGFMSHVNSCLMPAHVMPIHATFISHVSHAAPPHSSCHLIPNSFFSCQFMRKIRKFMFLMSKTKNSCRISCRNLQFFMSFMFKFPYFHVIHAK